MSKSSRSRNSHWILAGIISLAVSCLAIVIVLVERQISISLLSSKPTIEQNSGATPFPVGVNPETKIITEQPEVNTIHERLFASADPLPWWERTVTILVNERWYQQVASPVTRTFVIWPGQRQEEVVAHVQEIADWSPKEAKEFYNLVVGQHEKLKDGIFYPDFYVIHRAATPHEIASLVQKRFIEEIQSRYTPAVANTIPLKDALIIASLLEREAYDFTDMRIISGIIWNRLFSGMPLQLDATLQYAKASRASANWWPVPQSTDKFIDSPYNTYKYSGLPPGPIGNPSAEAVLAALNPRNTNCLYYLHADDGTFYCSQTYEEHRHRIAEIWQ